MTYLLNINQVKMLGMKNYVFTIGLYRKHQICVEKFLPPLFSPSSFISLLIPLLSSSFQLFFFYFKLWCHCQHLFLSFPSIFFSFHAFVFSYFLHLLILSHLTVTWAIVCNLWISTPKKKYIERDFKILHTIKTFNLNKKLKFIVIPS